MSLAYQWFDREELILNVLTFIHPQYVFFNTVPCTEPNRKKDFKFSPLWKVNKLWKELLFSERFCKLYYANCLCGGRDTLPFAPDACIVTKVAPPKPNKPRYDSYYGYLLEDSDEDEEAETETEFTDNYIVLKSTDYDDDEDDEFIRDYPYMSESLETKFDSYLKLKAKDQAGLNQLAMRAIRRTYLKVYPSLNFKDNFFQLMSILRGALVVYEGYNFAVSSKMKNLINSFKQYFPGGDLSKLETELCESTIKPVQNCRYKSGITANMARSIGYAPFYQQVEIFKNLKKVKLFNMFANPKYYIFGSIYSNVIIFKDDGNVLFYSSENDGNTTINGETTVTMIGSELHYTNTYFTNDKEVTPDIALMLEDIFTTMNTMFEVCQRHQVRSIAPPEKTAYNYYTNLMKNSLLVQNPEKSRKEIVSMISKMWKEMDAKEKDSHKKKWEEKKNQYSASLQKKTVVIRGLHNTRESVIVQFKRVRENEPFDLSAAFETPFSHPFIPPVSKYRRF